ncbi:MAG: OmpA family protein [Ignavibacteriaceae bacterium]
MKKIFYVIMVFVFSMSLADAQVSKDGWAIGFGAVSPRLFSDVSAENLDIGGQVVLQKNLSERTIVRSSLDYLKFTAKPTAFTNTTLKVGISVMYNLFPCEIISPYVGGGASGLVYDLTRPSDASIKAQSYYGEISADFFLGTLVNFSEDWFVQAELGEHTISSDKFDGQKGTSGGLFGGMLDSYTSISLGLLYYFDPGTRSTICDEATGLSSEKEKLIDYAKIEEIVRQYASTPANVDYGKIEDIVKRNSTGGLLRERVITSERGAGSGSANWVLVGVNFEFNKSALSPESYPILVNAVQVLLVNPDIKVEIQGHTDNIGSESFNTKLSKQRAETVKRFLVAKGVSASRLSTVGVGSSIPVADNKTAEGRSLNRRIEFKVLGK